MSSSAVCAIVSLGLCAACAAPPTLVVKVESDLTVPTELSQVGVVVHDASDVPVSATEFPLSVAADLPLSFGVVPVDDDASRKVAIEVSAYDSESDVLFVRRAVVGFESGDPRLLVMRLARRCVSDAPSCADGETCTEDGCVSQSVDVTSLPIVEPGAELGETTRTPDR